MVANREFNEDQYFGAVGIFYNGYRLADVQRKDENIFYLSWTKACACNMV